MDKETLKFYELMINDCGAVISDNDCLNHEKPESERVDCEICRLEFIRKKAVKETAEKILNEVGKVCGDYQWFKNLCKQYGVEIKG